MKSTTITAILLIALALAAAFLAGRCTKQKIKTSHITTTDTIYVRDTLRLPPVPSMVQVEKVVYVRDQKSLDSLAMIATRRANLFDALAERSRAIVEEMQHVIDSIQSIQVYEPAEGVGFPVAEDWPVNIYEGDTITSQNIGVSWKIKTLGELFEEPELVFFTPTTRTRTTITEAAKNRAFGLSVGVANMFDPGRVLFAPKAHYRRGALIFQAGPILDPTGQIQGIQTSAGIELGWRK